MRRLFRIWSLSLVAAFIAVFGSSAAYAAPAPNPNAGQGLEISPPVIELSANPGQTVTATIRVRNVTGGDLITRGKADDFGAGADESGQPKLLLDETGATRFSLKFWVQGVPDLRIAPGELKTAVIRIAVPANAEPGGHFGVVRFTGVPPELNGTGVALSASVGSLILMKVSGQITEKLSLAEFSTAQKSKKTTFFEHGPINFLVRLKNEGSIHEKAQGTITINDWLGRRTGIVAVNSNGGNILPDSVRRFDQQLDTKRLFGHYTAKLDLTYSNGKKLNGSIGFWVIPWKLILLCLLGLGVLGFLLVTGIRRYNDHIIAKARRR